MSDNIPFELQIEIIKRVSNVKSLIQFRSVSKPWKSFIDSSDFIKGYGARHTQPHSLILTRRANLVDAAQHFCLVDDDNCETFKVQQQEFAPSLVESPLLKQYWLLKVVGMCHGLLCLSCYNKDNYDKMMLVIWNPCIGKSFGIAFHRCLTEIRIVYGFGVCPVTSDPTVVKILCADNMPWHVEVFTLSSGVWTVIPSGNLPRHSIKLNPSTQVVIDRFIYWSAWEKTLSDDGESTLNHMVVSFDLITKEFKVVDLPYSLTNEIMECVFLSKLRDSLVVYGCNVVDGAIRCGAWVMEHDSSLRKLFTTGAPILIILGFKQNGETIFETQKDGWVTMLNVYDPCSQQIKNLGISGAANSFFMGSYKESLLLLNHLDSRIYDDNNLS